jgi:hypothetical protein
MAGRKKEHWTTADWIAFGNRVKKVRKELQSMTMEVQRVCRVRELDGLLKVVKELDKWKSRMEDIASKDVPPTIVTRVFYGEPIPRDALDCNRVPSEPEELNNLAFAIARGGYDVSPCMTCGAATVCIPDGLAMCRECAEKAIEQSD